MAMDKYSLFMNAMHRWPNEIRIISERPSEDSVATEPSLPEVYQAIEGQIDENDDWGQLAAWSFNQAINELALRKSNERYRELRPEQVPFELFDAMMASNLADKDWNQERLIYDQLPLTSA